MPSISYSRTRESDALVEQKLKEAVELEKQNKLIKYSEAQTMKVKHYKNPAPPENPQEAKAMQMLITRGPMRADELVPLLELVGVNKDELAVMIFHKLVEAGKAERVIEDSKVLYRLKQVEEMRDSPLKGKRAVFKDKPTIKKMVRDDGIESWEYSLDYDEVPI